MYCPSDKAQHQHQHNQLPSRTSLPIHTLPNYLTPHHIPPSPLPLPLLLLLPLIPTILLTTQLTSPIALLIPTHSISARDAAIFASSIAFSASRASVTVETTTFANSTYSACRCASRPLPVSERSRALSRRENARAVASRISRGSRAEVWKWGVGDVSLGLLGGVLVVVVVVVVLVL